MSEAPSLLDYQRQAASATRPPLRKVEPEEEQPWTDEADALQAAGWAYEVRQGKRIWCRSRGDPWSFWKSEEQAHRIARGGSMK